MFDRKKGKKLGKSRSFCKEVVGLPNSLFCFPGPPFRPLFTAVLLGRGAKEAERGLRLC